MKQKIFTIMSALVLGAGMMCATIKKVQIETTSNVYVEPTTNKLYYNIDTDYHTAEVARPLKGTYSSSQIAHFVIVPTTVTYNGSLYAVVGVEERAFMGCDQIQSFEMEDEENYLTYIGKEAFYQCTHLRYATLPEKLERIEDWTFAKCVRLSEVVIPASVGSIGENAFTGAIQPNSDPEDDDYFPSADFYMESATPPILEDNAFNEIDTTRLKIYAPCDWGALDNYKNNWRGLAHRVMHMPVSEQYELTIEQTAGGYVPEPQDWCDMPLQAIPDEGYKFVRWSDNTTENPHKEFGLYKDTTFFAVFEPIKCKFSIESNDEAKGTVSTTFTEAEYPYGTEITVEASAYSGNKFLRWNNGETENPYSFIIKQDTLIRANFYANDEEIETVEASAGKTSVLLKMPWVRQVDKYTFRIYYDPLCLFLFCTLHFDKDGHFVDIVYGSGAPRRTPADEEEGHSYLLEGLEEGTDYYYVTEARDEENKLLDTQEGEFKTLDTATAIEETNVSAPTKVMIDGRLMIRTADGKVYDVTGVKK